MNKDLLEGNSAATAIIAELDGKPLSDTSGDKDHKLNIADVKLNVKAAKGGEELEIVVNQGDVHHPGPAYDTIKKHISEMKEFEGYTAREIDPERDHDHNTGRITIRYDLPNAVADSIIHKLSERAQKENSLGKLLNDEHSQGWVAKIKTMKDKVCNYIGI